MRRGSAILIFVDVLFGLGPICVCAVRCLRGKLTKGTAALPADKAVPAVFMCNQHTRRASREVVRWIGNVVGPRASMPPFNKKAEGVPWPEQQEYNLPCFGPNIASAIMKLFGGEEIRALAIAHGVRIPDWELCRFVQGKMAKVRPLVEAAQLSHPHQAARLGAFIDAFAALRAEDIQDKAAWHAFVARHVDAGWEKRLHFDSLLGNFGFDDATATALRRKSYDGGGKPTSLEQHAMRWLSKAFGGYGPVGCLTDVLNLVFSLLDEQKLPMTEIAIVDGVEKLCTRLAAGQLDGLWIPDCMVHDAESDDMMAMLLLLSIHAKRGTSLSVLVQLPDHDTTRAVGDRLQRQVPNLSVFYDSDSENLAAVTLHHKL